MDKTQTQRFKFILPIVGTRVEIRKDAQGNDREVRIVRGVASSTDKDLHGDRMAPSAIKTMADSLKFHEVPLNADHDTTWSAEIGPVTELSVDEENRLIMEAELSEMSKANDLWYALTEKKKKLGLSIGGYVKEYEMVKEESSDEEDDDEERSSRWYRLYKDIDLDHVAVTSSPANPKTWVSAISKSIDKSQDELMIKEIEEKSGKKQSVRDLARRIARKIQDAEADLILNLAETILLSFDPLHLQKVEEYLNILERSMSMDKKDVSLEAEKSETSQVAEEATEEKNDETAALENEKSDESTETSQEQPSDEKSEEATETEGESEETTEEEAGDKTDDKEDDDSLESPDSKESDDKEDEDKTESTEKSQPQDNITELIKTLTENVKEVAEVNKQLVKDNEDLKRELSELKGEPAERKSVEVSKKLGDDSDEEESPEDLKKAMDEELATTRKSYANDPTLFSRIQRIRAKYALKGIQE